MPASSASSVTRTSLSASVERRLAHDDGHGRVAVEALPDRAEVERQQVALGRPCASLDGMPCTISSLIEAQIDGRERIAVARSP